MTHYKTSRKQRLIRKTTGTEIPAANTQLNYCNHLAHTGITDTLNSSVIPTVFKRYGSTFSHGRPGEAYRITNPPTTETSLPSLTPTMYISFISDLERARTGFDFRTRPLL